MACQGTLFLPFISMYLQALSKLVRKFKKLIALNKFLKQALI
jgi:hypothetical protein